MSRTGLKRTGELYHPFLYEVHDIASGGAAA
jgi:hypothetical protein